MKRNKIECPICHKMISKSNLSKHLKGHENNPERYFKKMQSVDHDGLECKYCGKLCKSKNSLAQHECRCKLNPERHISEKSNFSKHHVA